MERFLFCLAQGTVVVRIGSEIRLRGGAARCVGTRHYTTLPSDAAFLSVAPPASSANDRASVGVFLDC